MLKQLKAKDFISLGAPKPFGTSAMVASNFEGLVGYRTLRDEGQVLMKAYDYVFSRVLQASVRPCHPHIQSVPAEHQLVLVQRSLLNECYITITNLWLAERCVG